MDTNIRVVECQYANLKLIDVLKNSRLKCNQILLLIFYRFWGRFHLAHAQPYNEIDRHFAHLSDFEIDVVWIDRW